MIVKLSFLIFAVAADPSSRHLWHGVYATSRFQQSYSVYLSAPNELQALYAKGRLYGIRFGRRDLPYDQGLASFALLDASLVRQEGTRTSIAGIFQNRLEQLACRGRFLSQRHFFSRRFLYVLQVNRHSCHRVLVFWKSAVVFRSYERTDIDHLNIGVIQD